MHFAITIDTEVDKSPNWQVSNPETYTGIHEGVGRILQPLFNGYGVAPVYFLSNEILADPDLSSVFAPYHVADTAELATHLHFEAAGPLRLDNIAGRHINGIQAQLSEKQERETLTWLTNTFIARFGHRPTSFRAGRYGLGPNSIRILSDLGYQVDSSVTPGVVWDYRIGESNFRCDYRNASKYPYRCSTENVETRGEGPIVEIPISIQRSPLSVKEAIRLLIGRKRRYIWARPRFASKSEFRKMILAARNRGMDTDILVMMFHNMEVIPGKSPYSKTQRDANKYIEDITFFIETALSSGLKPITFRDYVEDYGSHL